MNPRNVVIAGFLGGGILILGLGFFIGNRQRPVGDNVPALSLSRPANGDTVSNPVTVQFTTSAALELGDMGWTANGLHLHIIADSTEIMPGAADISASPDGYVWRLPTLPSGEHRLFLTWAGRNHGSLRGVTDTIRIHIRP